MFPLTWPILSKLANWFFFIGNLPSFFFFFSLSFGSKFVLLKMPYFRFVSPKDRYFSITELKWSKIFKKPKLWVGWVETEISLIVALGLFQTSKILSFQTQISQFLGYFNKKNYIWNFFDLIYFRYSNFNTLIFKSKKQIQWNLSNTTQQGTREMYLVVLDVGIFRFYFS